MGIVGPGEESGGEAGRPGVACFALASVVPFCIPGAQQLSEHETLIE